MLAWYMCIDVFSRKVQHMWTNTLTNKILSSSKIRQIIQNQLKLKALTEKEAKHKK